MRLKRCRYIPVVFFLWAFSFSCVLLARAYSGQWQDLKGEHFIVYFFENEEFVKEVLHKAELYYQAIALDLGYPRYSEFWTWDNRVKIFIYPDHDSYLKASGHPAWSHGMADYEKKTILSYAFSANFVGSILPHEMAHLIFRDFVGFKGEVPLWLDEGVAQWEEAGKKQEVKKIVKELYENDSLLSLSDLMLFDVREISPVNKLYIRTTSTKTGEPGVLFLSSDSLIRQYYAQAASLVGFLIEKHGSQAFAHFCRELRDGKTLEEALFSAYSVGMSSLKELEKRWRQYLGESQK